MTHEAVRSFPIKPNKAGLKSPFCVNSCAKCFKCQVIQQKSHRLSTQVLLDTFNTVMFPINIQDTVFHFSVCLKYVIDPRPADVGLQQPE